MSKHINVNPDHYKVAGRERPGESVAAKAPKQPQAMSREEKERWDRRQEKRRMQQSADQSSHEGKTEERKTEEEE